MLLKPSQGSLFRALFGGYLFVHFVQLVPYGTELFSCRGVLPSASLSPLAFFFPNVLSVFDSPLLVTALLGAAATASLAFALGVHERATALGLWYAWACLLGRNPLIMNPSIPYVGWLLLVHACLPDRPIGDEIRGVGFILLAVGYTYSGLTKLASPSWLDGTAITWILENPLARPGFLRDALLSVSYPALKFATWSVLGLEIAFAPLAIVRKLRPWLWAAMLSVHIVLMALLSFADLSLGMVLFHLFAFDTGWFPPSLARNGRSRSVLVRAHSLNPGAASEGRPVP